jgi:hypothetical protein
MSCDWVTLRRHPVRWAKLPSRIRIAIVDGVERVRRIRSEIASHALVPVMPPVEVVDVCWTDPEQTGCIHGQSAPVTINGDQMFGAVISAPVVVHADDAALRGVLLHEFSHCFYFHRRVVEHVLSGRTDRLKIGRERANFLDDDRDREMLERPEDWFSKEDVEIFPFHDADLLERCTDRIATEWVGRGLPVEVPNRSFHLDRLSAPWPILHRIAHLTGRLRVTDATKAEVHHE